MMRRPSLSPSVLRPLAVVLGLGACSTPPPPPPPPPAPGLSGEQLAAPGEDNFLVSPRWAPDGRSLLVSGRGGLGLSLIELPAGSVRPLLSDFRGTASLVPDNQGHPTLLLEARPGEAQLLQLPSATADPGSSLTPPSPTRRPADLPAGPSAGQPLPDGRILLWEQAGIRLLFDPYQGLLVRDAATDQQVLAEDGAWGIRVTPAGQVAFCTGPLPGATLHVADLPAATHRELGPGAQPAWFPTKHRLIFTRPEPPASAGEAPTRAELWTADLTSGQLRQLTHTPDRMEMEPAVAPDGRRVAFADWQTGGIFVAEWAD